MLYLRSGTLLPPAMMRDTDTGSSRRQRGYPSSAPKQPIERITHWSIDDALPDLLSKRCHYLDIVVTAAPVQIECRRLLAVCLETPTFEIWRARNKRFANRRVVPIGSAD